MKTHNKGTKPLHSKLLSHVSKGVARCQLEAPTWCIPLLAGPMLLL